MTKMKVLVKTLKGTHFQIQVNISDTVFEVKKNIETVQGADVYPAAQQMLIHQGKILKDGTTLEENKVAENSFIVIMVSKTKSSTGEGSTATAASVKSLQSPQTSAAATPTSMSTVPQAPAMFGAMPVAVIAPAPASALAPALASALAPDPASTLAPNPTLASTAVPGSGVYGLAASNLVAESNSEGTIQQIVDMGGLSWDTDSVACALRAAYNNPERALEYLYSGILERVEAPPVAQVPGSTQPANPPAAAPQAAQPTPVTSSGPNANSLDLFPQDLPNIGAVDPSSLDFMHNSQPLQALRAMMRSNPQILEPMLLELGEPTPEVLRSIQAHQENFIRLINQPVEGSGEEYTAGRCHATRSDLHP